MGISKIRLGTYELKSKFAISFTKLVKWGCQVFLDDPTPCFSKGNCQGGPGRSNFYSLFKIFDTERG